MSRNTEIEMPNSLTRKIIALWILVVAIAVAGFVSLFIGGMDIWIALGISLICFALFFPAFNLAYSQTSVWMQARRASRE